MSVRPKVAAAPATPSFGLRERLRETRRRTAETGYYRGLERLTLKERDPLRFELFHSRILSALIAARETTRMISGSPIVREVAELLVCLYTPEGDCVAQSTGIQVHTLTVGRAIQWMIEHGYEENPGIQPGDVFTCNDCSIAGMHPADVYDILPLFYGDTLVGWAATVIMEAEIGATSPGCMPAANVERYTDGLYISAEKTAVGYELRRDFEIRCERSLRLPALFLLDRKGAIAADRKVEEEVRRIIEEFGLEYFLSACAELIEDERRGQLARMKERTVPGRYRALAVLEIPLSRLPVPAHARKDVLRLLPFEMTIRPDGSGSLDFDGAGAWGWHSMNGTPSGIEGGLSISLVQRLSYEGRANLGTCLPWEIRVPRDTILDPSLIERLPTANIWSPVISIFGVWHSLLSRAFFARGYREEVLLGQPRSTGFEYGGFDQYGRYATMINFEIAGANGSGARGVEDGLASGFQVWNAEVDSGNLEVFELTMPHVSLGRRLSPDSGGAGKYRGGNDLACTYLIHGARPYALGATMAVTNTFRVLPNTAIFGGLPGPVPYWYFVRGADIRRLVEDKKPLVHGEGDPRNPDVYRLGGKVERVGTLVLEELHDFDLVQQLNHSSNGGYGDPIERDPERVRRDLDDGAVTPWAAREVYAVAPVFDEASEQWKVDLAETRRLREERRRRRLERSVPVEQWWRQQRQRLLAGELDPMLVEAYRSSFSLGPRFRREFLEFWGLPEDFEFPGVPA